jgi:hypothetical protein
MDVLPGPHANVLIYLISFIRQIFEWPVFLQNPEAKRRISTVLEDSADSSSSFLKSINTESDEGWFRGCTTEGDVDCKGRGGLRIHIYINSLTSIGDRHSSFTILAIMWSALNLLHTLHLILGTQKWGTVSK